jgi:hypothetical protein
LEGGIIKRSLRVFLQNKPKCPRFQLKNKDRQKNKPKFFCGTAALGCVQVLQNEPKTNPKCGTDALGCGHSIQPEGMSELLPFPFSSKQSQFAFAVRLRYNPAKMKFIERTQV